MPVVLAFGDSNTWGFEPVAATRYPKAVRWTGILARSLGESFEVIEEGLNGRTTVFDDPEEAGRIGLSYLAPCLRSHAPLDLAIIALGCNDCKAAFGATPKQIAAGAARLIDAALESEAGPGGRPPRVILVAPPPIATLTEYAGMFAGGHERALGLPAAYRALAQTRGIGYVDAGAFIRCSDRDGIHFEPDQHAILGQAMAEAVKMMLG